MYPVFLNVYDVTNTQSDNTKHVIVKLNNVTRDMGFGGIFHGAVEIDGYEWSFGYCEEGSGVYACQARKNTLYLFRESIELGPSPKSRQEIKQILQRYKAEWRGDSYELLGRNCCHFCEELARDLGVKPTPGWLNRFAVGADATVKGISDAHAFARKVSQDVSRSAQNSATWLRDSFTRLVTSTSGAFTPSIMDDDLATTSSASTGSSYFLGTASSPQIYGSGPNEAPNQSPLMSRFRSLRSTPNLGVFPSQPSARSRWFGDTDTPSDGARGFLFGLIQGKQDKLDDDSSVGDSMSISISRSGSEVDISVRPLPTQAPMQQVIAGPAKSADPMSHVGTQGSLEQGAPGAGPALGGGAQGAQRQAAPLTSPVVLPSGEGRHLLDM